MLSIVIPSRGEQFLYKTIEELLAKAKGEVEVIAVLDGTPQDVPEDPRVKVVQFGASKGMRPAINAGVTISRGDYVMKIDGHCMVDEGFDVKLAEDCDSDWVVVPRRKRLDAENWCIQDVGKPDIDYEYLSFDEPGGGGMHRLNGKIWTERIRDRAHTRYDIDENIAFQGSCWFMPKKLFEFLELMDHENWGGFWSEAQEIAFKAWLSGGKVMTNKKTWYAHLHKGKKYGRGYALGHNQKGIAEDYKLQWLINEKMWHKQKYPLTWLIERFMPMPGWPEDKTQWVPVTN